MTNNTYIDYRKTLINIPITSACDLLYGFSHKLSLDMDETMLLLDLLIKENKLMESQILIYKINPLDAIM